MSLRCSNCNILLATNDLVGLSMQTISTCDRCGAVYCSACAHKCLTTVQDHGQDTKRACYKCVSKCHLKVLDPNNPQYLQDKHTT